MRVWKYLGSVMLFSLALCAQNAKTDIVVRPDPEVKRMNSVPEEMIRHKEMPGYPADAAEHQIQGVVKISVTIGPDGRVEKVSLISGHPLLAPAAMQAVRRWTFAPQGTDEHPVRVITTIEIPVMPESTRMPSAHR